MGRNVILSIQQLQALYNTTLSNELLTMFNHLDLAALLLEAQIQMCNRSTPRASNAQMTSEKRQSLHPYFQIGHLNLAIAILKKEYSTLYITAKAEKLLSHCFTPLHEIPDLQTQPEQVQIQIKTRQRNVRALLHRLELLNLQQS